VAAVYAAQLCCVFIGLDVRWVIGVVAAGVARRALECGDRVSVLKVALRNAVGRAERNNGVSPAYQSLWQASVVVLPVRVRHPSKAFPAASAQVRLVVWQAPGRRLMRWLPVRADVDVREDRSVCEA
jgi:hypothetical protein